MSGNDSASLYLRNKMFVVGCCICVLGFIFFAVHWILALLTLIIGGIVVIKGAVAVSSSEAELGAPPGGSAVKRSKKKGLREDCPFLVKEARGGDIYVGCAVCTYRATHGSDAIRPGMIHQYGELFYSWVCPKCKAEEIITRVPCKNLSLGIDAVGAKNIEMKVKASCKKKVQNISNWQNCSPSCSDFEPFDSLGDWIVENIQGQ